MANERTYPCLPCGEIDESIAFYESLGFKRTTDRSVRTHTRSLPAKIYRSISLASTVLIPAESYGSVIVAVPDPDSLYHDFAAGLRKAHGKLPVAGIPRITATAEKIRHRAWIQCRRPGRELAADL